MVHLSKYIVVTGGVVSSIGKGITAASIGRILRSYGVDVTAIKIDPYLTGILVLLTRISMVKFLLQKMEWKQT